MANEVSEGVLSQFRLISGGSAMLGEVIVTFPREEGRMSVGLMLPIVKFGPPGKPPTTCWISNQS